LLTWQAWVLVGAVISLGIGYYYFRELYDPGYILAVINNEVGGRFSGQHNSYRSYYVVRILERDIVLVVLALLMPFAFFDGNFRIRSFAVLCSLFTGSLLIILTLSYNKHYWYLAPAYPLLTMAVALGISSALRR